MSARLTTRDLTPVSQGDLETVGIRTRLGNAPEERGEDILARYLAVPNRMMLLYSSEDSIFADYVTQNWAALDGMSGQVCDIYTSLLQLSGDEDIYSFLDDIQFIPGAALVRFEKLPIILLWSDAVSFCISLHEFSEDPTSLKGFMRAILQTLRDLGRAISSEDEESLKASLAAATNGQRLGGETYSINIERMVSMTNEYRADRGGVIVSNGAKARDITTNQTWSQSAIDLPTLAMELAKLRIAMRASADGTDPLHDVAIGQVAIAEGAAKSGDHKATESALRSAGHWALSVAEKIGVDVATNALKSSLGLSAS